MQVSIRLPPALAQYADGQTRLRYEFADEVATVAEVLGRLEADHPAIGRRVRDEQAQVRRHVNVFVAADNIRDAKGQATEIRDGQEITILAAVSGGAF